MNLPENKAYTMPPMAVAPTASTVPIKPLVARASSPPKATAGAVHAKKRKNTAERLFKLSPSTQLNEQILQM